jgi:hypothetical protein
VKESGGSALTFRQPFRRRQGLGVGRATPLARSSSPRVPEAVIVATARSAIGRAVKESLREMRPDGLAVQMLRAPGVQPPKRRGPGVRRLARTVARSPTRSSGVTTHWPTGHRRAVYARPANPTPRIDEAPRERPGGGRSGVLSTIHIQISSNGRARLWCVHDPMLGRVGDLFVACARGPRLSQP